MALPMQNMMQQQNIMQPMAQQYGIRALDEAKKPSLGKRIKRGLFGEKEKFYQVPTVTPQAMEVLSQLLSGGLGRLQNPLEGFGDVENYAKEQFHGNIIPSIAERFTSLGGAGTGQNSGLQGALGAAGAGLASQLAALRHEYGLENRASALDELKMGLFPQFENIHRPSTGGALGEAWNTGKQASMQLIKILPYLL